MSEQNMLDAALAALRAGLSVLPIKDDGSKKPDLITWSEYQQDLPTEAQVNGWFGNGSRHGLAIIGGKVSRNLEFLDFEGRAVKAGIWEAFKAACDAAGLGDVLGAITNGHGERTPGGGLHIGHFVVGGDAKGNTKLAQRINAETGRPEVLIETRGEGGYCVVAPSGGSVHAEGGSWELLAGGVDTIATITTEQRDALHEIAASFDEMPREEWQRKEPVASDESRPGDDFNARADWARDVLEPAGWSFTGIIDGHQRWYRKTGGRRGWTSATITSDGQCLYVFSTSTELPTEVGLSKFRAYTFLHHGGDFKAAAKALVEQGYGEQTGKIIHSGGGASAASTSAVTSEDIPNLPEEFWAARKIFQVIRQAAHAAAMAGDAVLMAVLARIAAGVPYEVRLPGTVGAPVPLSLIVNLVGDSGAGKSGADRIGALLVPLDRERVVDHAPLGTGEGLAELLYETVEEQNPKDPKKTIRVRRQTRHNAFIYVDEGTAMIALVKRKDSTVLSTIRSIYSGAELGQANASEDRRRIVPYGTHTFGFVIAIQELVAAEILNHESDGTPQRFLWISSFDKSVPFDPPETPVVNLDPYQTFLRVMDVANRRNGGKQREAGQPFAMKLDPVIAKETRVVRVAYVHNEPGRDPMKAHHNLTRLKVAGCLAVLDQRADINLEDWKLAGMIMDTSDAVLAHMRRVIGKDEERREASSTARIVRRRVAEVKAIDEVAERRERVESCATSIKERVEGQPGVSVGDVRRSVSKRFREIFEEGLARAKTQGWVEERSEKEPGDRDAKRALYPGDK